MSAKPQSAARRGEANAPRAQYKPRPQEKLRAAAGDGLGRSGGRRLVLHERHLQLHERVVACALVHQARAHGGDLAVVRVQPALAGTRRGRARLLGHGWPLGRRQAGQRQLGGRIDGLEDACRQLRGDPEAAAVALAAARSVPMRGRTTYSASACGSSASEKSARHWPLEKFHILSEPWWPPVIRRRPDRPVSVHRRLLGERFFFFRPAARRAHPSNQSTRQ
jgi:hypothetical protein